MMSPTSQAVLAQVERIETEMKRIGRWQESPLEAEQYNFRAAFASDTMPFAQWLQFIFLPNVRRAVDRNLFPAESHVAAQAVREFDSVPDASRLITLLTEFDAMF